MTLKEAVTALVFFTFLTLIFFYKIFFGLIPLPTDLIVGAYYPWLSYKWGYSVGVPVQNAKLSDAVSLFYPPKTLAVDLEKKGELPLWNPYMFAGYPLFASPQFGLLFPTMIFYLAFAPHIAWTLQVMSQPIFACFFMYLLLRHFKLGKIPSVFGSIVYGFGGSTILWIQWNTQATTSLFLPILILLEDKYLISKQLKYGALLSIFFSLQILAGYPPIIPFTLLAMAIWYLFRSNQYFQDLKILIFFVLGLSLSAIFLFPVAELIINSQRLVETLDSGVPFFAPENLINLIAPDFFGNPATGNFWGRGDNMDSTIYAGVTTLIFSLIALKKFFKKTEVKFASCLFILALIIAISNPLSIFLYKLGLWGGASMTMNRINFLTNFSLALLGAYGISSLKNSTKLSLKPYIAILLIILGIGTYLFFIKSSLNSTDILLAHINISLKNLSLPLFIIATVLLLVLIFNKFKQFKLVAPIMFILILIFELFRFGLKFNTFSSPNFIYPQTPISKYLEKYPSDRFIAERVVLPANMWVAFRLSSMAGYDGTYPINTAQLLAVANSGKIDTAPQTRWGILENFDSKILDETNTRFLVTLKRNNNGDISENGQIDNKFKLPKFKEVFEDRGVVILENTQSLPRVYLTKQVIKTTDKNTLKLLIDENFPIKQTSITQDLEFNSTSTESLNSNLTYNPITNSHILIKTTSNIDSYLVVLDSFYPGWKALIDGSETTIHRTNYNFRGVFLPKGIHNVEFVYFPKSLEYGIIISVVSLVIIILLLTKPKFFQK